MISKSELMIDILHRGKARTSQRRFTLTEDILPSCRGAGGFLRHSWSTFAVCGWLAVIRARQGMWGAENRGGGSTGCKGGRQRVWGAEDVGGSPGTGRKGGPRVEVGCDSARALGEIWEFLCSFTCSKNAHRAWGGGQKRIDVFKFGDLTLWTKSLNW